LRTGLQLPSIPGTIMRETQARPGRERQSNAQSFEICRRVFAAAEQPVMLVGLEV
jgi:hypothetical protein